MKPTHTKCRALMKVGLMTLLAIHTATKAQEMRKSFADAAQVDAQTSSSFEATNLVPSLAPVNLVPTLPTNHVLPPGYMRSTNAVFVGPLIPASNAVVKLCWHAQMVGDVHSYWTNTETGEVMNVWYYAASNPVMLRWLKSTNVISGPWMPLPGAWPMDGSTNTLRDTNAIGTNRTQFFYKAIAELPIAPTITVTNQ